MQIQTVQSDFKPYPSTVRFSDENKLFQVYMRSEEIVGGGVGGEGDNHYCLSLPILLQSIDGCGLSVL